MMRVWGNYRIKLALIFICGMVCGAAITLGFYSTPQDGLQEVQSIKDTVQLIDEKVNEISQKIEGQ